MTTDSEAATEMCHRRSGEILTALKETEGRITGRLDTMNGTVGTHDREIGVIKHEQGTQGREIKTLRLDVKAMGATLAQRAGQAAIIVAVATAVATALKYALG